MGYILKQGLAELKKKGKKIPGLDLDKVIGDFLVEQGLATTEDCCDYTAVSPAVNNITIAATTLIEENLQEYAPEGWDTSSLFLVSGDSSIRGISSLSINGISDGDVKTFTNIGNNTIYFAGEYPASLASTRMSLREDFLLFPKQSCSFVYSTITERWHLLSAMPDIQTVAPVYYSWSASSPSSGDLADVALASINSGLVGAFGGSTLRPVAFSLSNSSSSTGGGQVYMLKSIFHAVGLPGTYVSARGTLSMTSLSTDAETFTTSFQITSLPSSTSILPNSTTGVRYSHNVNEGRWQGFTVDSVGTIATVDLLIPVTVSTLYNINIVINKNNSEVRFYIDGVLQGYLANNPISALGVGCKIIMLKSNGTGTKFTYAHSMSLFGIQQ